MFTLELFDKLISAIDERYPLTKVACGYLVTHYHENTDAKRIAIDCLISTTDDQADLIQYQNRHQTLLDEYPWVLLKDLSRGTDDSEYRLHKAVGALVVGYINTLLELGGESLVLDSMFIERLWKLGEEFDLADENREVKLMGEDPTRVGSLMLTRCYRALT